MKRYLIFIFEQYYPGGGMNDFQIDFDAIEDVKIWINVNYQFPDYSHIQVFDSETREEISF